MRQRMLKKSPIAELVANGRFELCNIMHPSSFGASLNRHLYNLTSFHHILRIDSHSGGWLFVTLQSCQRTKLVRSYDRLDPIALKQRLHNGRHHVC